MDSFNVIAETRYGRFLYNRHDQVIGRLLDLYGEYSESEVALLRQLCSPGSVVADVGANIGAITVPLAMHVGEHGYVYAFEPQRIVFQTLAANVALQSLTNVECVAAAVGEREGIVHIPDLRYDLDANFGGFELAQFSNGRPTRMCALDDFAGLAHFSLIKIDVEGMEAEVIRGARALIRAQRPLLYVENDRADRSAELIAEIRSLGYRLYWHHAPLFNPSNHRGNTTNIFAADAAFRNMLCVPSERPATVTGFQEILGGD